MWHTFTLQDSCSSRESWFEVSEGTEFALAGLHLCALNFRNATQFDTSHRSSLPALFCHIHAVAMCVSSSSDTAFPGPAQQRLPQQDVSPAEDPRGAAEDDGGVWVQRRWEPVGPAFRQVVIISHNPIATSSMTASSPSMTDSSPSMTAYSRSSVVAELRGDDGFSAVLPPAVAMTAAEGAPCVRSDVDIDCPAHPFVAERCAGE